MGEVLAVEEVWRKLLQAAAGQIHRVDSLGHHLREQKSGEGTDREGNVEFNRIISQHMTKLVYCGCV